MAEMQSLGEAIKDIKLPSRAPKLDMSPQERQERLQEIENEANAQNYQNMLKARRGTIKGYSVWGTCGKESFTADDWRTDVQPTEKGRQKASEIKRKAAQICKRLMRDDFNIAFVGGAGLGKTALALVVLDFVENHTSKSVMYVSVADLRELILYDFNDHEAKKRLDNVERAMREADVLLLDDLGSEAGGMKGGGQAPESVQRFYYRVSQHRQKQVDGKKIYTTIVTTNNTLGELSAIYNEKIVSRLFAKSPDNIIVFNDMEDMRK